MTGDLAVGTQRSRKERAYGCSACGDCIVVIGPDSQVDAALRRVDWERTGGVVTCRRCR